HGFRHVHDTARPDVPARGDDVDCVSAWTAEPLQRRIALTTTEQTIPLGPAGPASPRGAGARGVLAAPATAGPGLAGTIALSILATGLPALFHLAGAPARIAMSVLLGLIIACIAPSVVPVVLVF